MKIDVRRIDSNLELPIPAKLGDAGVDLFASEDTELFPGVRKIIPTGLAIAIPVGYCGFILPRSGLAAKHGLTVVNSPGLIDSGYRGELKIILLNTDMNNPVHLSRGERIAQLVISKHETVEWNEVKILDETERGEGRFGHSGL